MGKSFFVGFLVICLLLMPQVALGLTTGGRAKGGETTLMFVGDKGLQLNTEYGVTSEVGLCVAIRKDATKIGRNTNSIPI